MLNAKNGVITEERFQKLNKIQWLFHYLEVMREKDRDYKDKSELIKSMVELYSSGIKSLAETIIDGAKLTGSMANPDAGKALMEAEKLKDLKADIGDDDFSEFWEEFSSRIPGELVIEDMGDHVDLAGDGIDLEKLYEIDMAHRRKVMQEQKLKEKGKQEQE